LNKQQDLYTSSAVQLDYPFSGVQFLFRFRDKVCRAAAGRDMHAGWPCLFVIVRIRPADEQQLTETNGVGSSSKTDPGPICSTQPDPIHFRNDPTQPNPSKRNRDTAQHYRTVFYVSNIQVTQGTRCSVTYRTDIIKSAANTTHFPLDLSEIKLKKNCSLDPTRPTR